MRILRKLIVIFLTLTLCFTTVACGGGAKQTLPPTGNLRQPSTAATKLNDGQYPVQQATYDDVNGEYTLFLLNATPPTFRTQNVQMARLTDEEIKQGQKTNLKVQNGESVLYLTEDFKIEYVHNVTENRTNPQTGQQEQVVVRRENGFWAPFAGAVAGQAIGSLLFRPHYYVPPVYQPGVSVLNGYGGYGRSYGDAVSSYRQRYNTPPAEVRNRTAFRSTGTIRRSSPNDFNVRRTVPPNSSINRPTGSGYGGSILQPSGRSGSARRPSGSAFGSGRRAPSRSGFGSRRR
ncbi:MAG: hypothetical protein PUP91_12260 [Rhizonema sp. PD37]|nr:hypothetical protein [Rhizonema sp. PD37]